jgi:hypothetical protein
MSGRDVKGYLDGKLYLEHTPSGPVSGKQRNGPRA